MSRGMRKSLLMSCPTKSRLISHIDMPALLDYLAGMNKRHSVQYTIRQVPERVDKILREKALREGSSLNEEAVDALARGLGVSGQETRYHDLDELAGTWVKDPAFDRAIRDMDKVDPELWK
jgi:hypothetical protein